MADRKDKYITLSNQYPDFVYEAYHYEISNGELKVWFDFRVGDIEFHPSAVVEQRYFLDTTYSDLEWTVFNIGMVELVSYWKCVCSPNVHVKCGALTEAMAAFWKKLYWHGLGEFFYTNGLLEDVSFDGETPFMTINSSGRAIVCPATVYKQYTDSSMSYLVPIGGGKDSVVTLELLKQAGRTVRPLIMNPRGATIGCAQVAGYPLHEVLVIRRTIDPTLLELNSKGYLNGHTPFSAMLAFYTLLASQLSGIPNVALSNESSANESTVIGSTVNHQYSKSLEFEDDFRAYCSGIRQFNYFSFLRPLAELQIAMLFSRLQKYHDVFRSCNVGSKQDIWCGRCAKCLFAYIILSPFITPSRLNQIFGHPLLDDMLLKHEFMQLTGCAESKPFECVGTIDEVRQALDMARSTWYHEGEPALMKMLDAEPLRYRAVDLNHVPHLGNLSAEEYKILEKACIERNK